MSHRRPLLVALAVFVLVVPAAAPVLGAGGSAADAAERGAAADAPAAQDATIEESVTLSLTPERAGSVRVTVDYALPRSVSGFEVRVPEDATVRSATAFDRVGPRTFEWAGGDRTPSLAMDVTANETGDGRRLARDAHGLSRAADRATPHGDLVFADPGPWALVAVPQFGTRWQFRGGDVDLVTSVDVAGPGATGGEMAYLGAVTEHETTAAGQRIRLVVPETAGMTESPEDVLASLAGMSRHLDAGARDEEVVVIAAPTGVPWGVRGLQFGDDDAWVLADSRLDDVENVWLHEYVHTRQDFDTAADARWVVEGSAEYYAALFSLRQGHVDFRTFRRHLAAGRDARYGDSVLASPATWTPNTPYAKGALAFGLTDYRLRAGTDATARGDDVLRRLNARDGPVALADLVAAVRAEGGDAAAAATRRDTTSRDLPPPWTAGEHADAFVDVGALFTYRDATDGLAVTGPYRNRTVAGPLVVGETLTTAVVVANRGEEAGPFELTYRAGDVTRTENGSLAPGETTRLEFARTFDAPGTYEVVAGEVRQPVRVVQPGTAAVSRLSVDPGTVSVGEQVTVTATVTGASERPSLTQVAVRADGETVATRTVRLDAGEQRTVTVRTTLAEPGSYRVTAGNRSVGLAVRAGGDDADGTDADPLAGVGPAIAAVLVLAAAAGVATRRS